MAGLYTYKQLGLNVTIVAIDHSVGRGGRNRMDDVQLIQVLINRHIDETEEVHKQLPGPSYDTRVVDKRGRTIDDLVVDGRCGTLTLAAILATQRSLDKWKGCAVDGRIDAIPDGAASQYKTGRVQTYAFGLRGNQVVREPIMESRFKCMYLLGLAATDSFARTPWNILSLPEPLKSALLRSFLGW